MRPVADGPVTLVAGFLDGVQSSRVVRWAGAAPVVHAAVGAVVLQRVQRTLRTWRAPVARRAFFAPLSALDPATRAAMATADVVDVPAAAAGHPWAVGAAVLDAVGTAREQAERAALAAWLAAEAGRLYLDGPLVGAAPAVIAVVKSHRVLYAAPAALDQVLTLPVGHRTAVVEVRGDGRPPVWSWYLRLHRDGTDPFHGLVRVEVTADGEPTSRADDASRSVLAERAPVARPDPRWHVMPYGIAQCEAVLRRGVGLAA